MEKINLKIQQVKQNIAQVVAESKLPVGLAYYIMKDLTQELEQAYFEIVNKEHEELKKQQQENKEKENQQ